jgi:hypothetical protein
MINKLTANQVARAGPGKYGLLSAFRTSVSGLNPGMASRGSTRLSQPHAGCDLLRSESLQFETLGIRFTRRVRHDSLIRSRITC